MNHTILFESLTVSSNLKLKNRLVMAPMTTTSGEPDGSFSSQEISYLEQRSEAGIGLIMTPACFCHISGKSFPNQVGCHNDDMIPSLSACAEAINKHGAASFLQIHHGGNAAKMKLSGTQPIAPSALKNREGTSELPREMTEEDIFEIIDSFAKAAARAKRAGFTGIELHGANRYLFQQFFSPFTNRRTDKWGSATIAHRTRFAYEVVKAVREEVGPDYPISYRVSPEEPDPDGYSTYDAIEMLDLIVPLGIDIVHVSSWEYGSGLRKDWPEGTHPTQMIRRALPDDIPVVGVGGISHPDQAEDVLGDGIDLVAMGTILLLESNWVSKVRHGKEETLKTRVRTEEELQALQIPDKMKIYCRRFLLPTQS